MTFSMCYIKVKIKLNWYSRFSLTYLNEYQNTIRKTHKSNLKLISPTWISIYHMQCNRKENTHIQYIGRYMQTGIPIIAKTKLKCHDFQFKYTLVQKNLCMKVTVVVICPAIHIGTNRTVY